MVYCLVDLYLALGESLSPYLEDLTDSQMKLLRVYITRAMESSEGMKYVAAKANSTGE